MFKGQILGRLGRDAAVYESANGTQFLAFTLAVNTRNMGKDVTYWVDVRSFHPNHIKLAQYLQKGKILQVGGDLNATIATDKVGVVRINHTLFADYINFINLGGTTKDGVKITTGTTTAAQTEVNEDEEISMGNYTPQATAPTPTSTVQTAVSGVAETVAVSAGVDVSDDLPF